MELKIAQIQMSVTADREENIRRTCDMVRQAGDIHMAVLPEMFCCPYDNACFHPYGEAEGGPAYQTLSALAKERGIWLVGGTVPELAKKAGAHHTIRIRTDLGEEIHQSGDIGVDLLALLEDLKRRGTAVRDIQIDRGTLERYFIDMTRGDGR